MQEHTDADQRKIIEKYQRPSHRRAIWQILSTLSIYFILWYFSYRLMAVSYLLSLPLIFLTGAVLTRVFIIFHDCGHGSFFRSRRANDLLGFIAGVLVFTPYHNWRWEHSIHHASAGNLDRRGTGDVRTLTVHEYLALSEGQRFVYRLVRNPFILFGLAPFYIFVIQNRCPASVGAKARERRSVMWMNLAILSSAVAASSVFGLKAYLAIQLPSLIVAGSIGIWMFYVQHQFDGVYWERNDSWDFTQAAMRGSSFYKLPRILQWFTGNIGFHHIHHLSSRIPNYNLEFCHDALGDATGIKPITFLSAFRSISFRLWDEDRKELISYAQLTKSQKSG